MIKEKKQNRRSRGSLPYSVGHGDVRRKSFAPFAPPKIFSPDLPPIDEEEASDSSIETEDEEVEERCGQDCIVDDLNRDVEVFFRF